MNWTSIYLKLVVVLAVKIFILENCTSSWWVISLIFSILSILPMYLNFCLYNSNFIFSVFFFNKINVRFQILWISYLLISLFFFFFKLRRCDGLIVENWNLHTWKGTTLPVVVIVNCVMGLNSLYSSNWIWLKQTL